MKLKYAEKTTKHRYTQQIHREATNTNFIVLFLPDQGSNPQSMAREAITITIRSPIWLCIYVDK